MQLPQQSSFRTIILSLKFPQDYLQKKYFTEFSTVHIHDLKKNFSGNQEWKEMSSTRQRASMKNQQLTTYLMEKGQCSQIKQRCLLSPLPFNIVQDVLALAITQETKKAYSWEGIRKSLFADNIILYVKSAT